jgi:replicative DNA helicase
VSAVPAQNLEAEESVLGAMLVTEAVVEPVLVRRGLRPEHFYKERHRKIFSAISRLVAASEPVDVITVCETLRESGELEEVGGRNAIASLAATVAAPGSAAHWAEIVLASAQMRELDGIGKQICRSVAQRDADPAQLFAHARSLLDRPMIRRDGDFDPDDLADLAYRIAEEGGASGYPWPFDRLQERSRQIGIRKGQLIVISGHTHFGKTAFCHQVLDAVAKAGARTRLYINEMDEEEHLGGILQRLGDVPYEDFIRGRLDAQGRKRMVELINRGDLRWGITRCAGWSAAEVCAHIRLHRRDVVGVDMLHNFPYDDERQLSGMVASFQETAKVADCAIILVCHVNRNRITSGVRPRPTRGDLRGTGDIENKADVVCFVHRDQDPRTYEPLEGSYIYFDKYRGGKLGGLGTDDHPLTFNERRIRFEPVEQTMLARQLARAA